MKRKTLACFISVVQPHLGAPATRTFPSSQKNICPPFSIRNQQLFFFQPPQSRTAHPHFTMGTGKKEAARKIRQGKVGDGMANVKVKGENFYR